MNEVEVYHTDIDDLPDTELTQSVLNDLNTIKNIDEEVVHVSPKKTVSMFVSPLVDTGIVAVIVFLITNKAFLRWFLSLPLLGKTKTSLMFNAVLALMASIIFYIIKIIIKL